MKIACPKVKEPKVEKQVKMMSKSKPVVNSTPKNRENPKNPHFCHHCGASRHTHRNCFKFHAEKKVAMKEKVTKVNTQNPMPLLGEIVKALNLIVKNQGLEAASYWSKPKARKTRPIHAPSKIWVEKTFDV